jgi:hypothetical protein
MVQAAGRSSARRVLEEPSPTGTIMGVLDNLELLPLPLLLAATAVRVAGKIHALREPRRVLWTTFVLTCTAISAALNGAGTLALGCTQFWWSFEGLERAFRWAPTTMLRPGQSQRKALDLTDVMIRNFSLPCGRGERHLP